MSDTSRAIDGRTLDALIACHISSYGRSIRDTDPWLSNQLRDADDMTANLAHTAIGCFENHDLLQDFPEANSIGWRLFTDGFDLAIELAALVSRSPLTPDPKALEDAFTEMRSGIVDLVESARSDRALHTAPMEAQS